MKRLATISAAVIGVILLLSGCGAGAENTVLLGATTSVSDPGLLDELVKVFEQENGYHVTPVIGGSGDILARARRGELDVIMTHSPSDEKAFLDDGQGIEPKGVMENFFVVAGPADDPAGVASTSTLGDAFRVIAAAKAPFISRGDASGTNKRELATWASLGIDPKGQPWYQESAVGQGQNVMVASDKGGYTLVDSSTFVSMQANVQLRPLCTDEDQPNIYTVMVVNPDKHGNVNVNAARAWANFVTGASGQAVIASFGKEKYGEALFVPLAKVVRDGSLP
ncbi:MAG TPA: substrate-binding domain-containing protein [Dehalococcoidia bacterium]|nr:substrate-binding domain-containing protein [Dehalococcoidia bacterium]